MTLEPLCKDGSFEYGVLTRVGKNFGVHWTTVKKLWNANAAFAGQALSIPAEKFSRREQRGRTRVYDRGEELIERVKSIPISRRRTYRDLAAELDIPLATIYRIIIDGAFRKHSSSLKPILTEENKVERLEWCENHVDSHTGDYSEMLDVIHINEKWFNMTELTKSCYLAEDEEDPYRTVRHKSHIPRIMFLATTARPRWCPHRKMMWDGKIGLWECVDYVAAKRSSRNRPAGTIEIKPYNIDGKRYRALILDKLLPAIKEKCPIAMLNNRIFIQHDNAPPHKAVSTALPEFVAKSLELGIDVAIWEQPPNSPDLNVLDLGIFCALQCRQFRNCLTTLQEFMDQTRQMYDEFPIKLLNGVWYMLQTVMKEITHCNGGNKYKLVHSSKSKLERLGLLRRCIKAHALHPIFQNNNGDDGDDGHNGNDGGDDDDEEIPGAVTI